MRTGTPEIARRDSGGRHLGDDLRLAGGPRRCHQLRQRRRRQEDLIRLIERVPDTGRNGDGRPWRERTIGENDESLHG